MNMETTTFTYGTVFSLFLLVDGWLMFDGLQCICLFDVTSNAWKLLSVEMKMTVEITSKSVIPVCNQ